MIEPEFRDALVDFAALHFELLIKAIEWCASVFEEMIFGGLC